MGNPSPKNSHAGGSDCAAACASTDRSSPAACASAGCPTACDADCGRTNYLLCCSNHVLRCANHLQCSNNLWCPNHVLRCTNPLRFTIRRKFHQVRSICTRNELACFTVVDEKQGGNR